MEENKAVVAEQVAPKVPVSASTENSEQANAKVQEVTQEEVSENVVEEPAVTEQPAPAVEEVAAPVEEAVAPVAEPAAPVEEVAAPAEEVAPLAEEVAAPTEEVAPLAEDVAAEAEEVAEADFAVPATKAEVVERLQELAASEKDVERAELEALKQAYYRLHKAEVTAAREQFVADGGEADAFMPQPDATEEAFKEALNRVKELRLRSAERDEKEKQQNLKRKLEIIEKIKEMTVSADVADKSYNDFKQLQAEWKELGQVPAERATELWKTYQLQVEQFYDQLRLNNEFRAYDFKKNLEIKTHLCEAAEKLADVEDPVSAFHQLQQLHAQFREAGPVAKDLREEIWTRFKAASTLVNKRHQEHFEKLKEQEEENLKKKTELCERLEAVDLSQAKTFNDWEKLTKQVIDLQNEWRTIGFTPKKVNAKIFERFRAACDKFFQQKAEYFKQLRETWAANLAEKNRLIEEAEALKESTDWNATANKLVELQKQWKNIGPTAHKVSEAVWKRFNEACNTFFERKNAATSGQREEENANLEKKNQIIEKLEALLVEGAQDAQEKLTELTQLWNETGHVPFRKKDAVIKRYHAAVDRLRTELHISAGRRNMEKFRTQVSQKVGSELEREYLRLKNIFDTKKEEVVNYETNLSFFNSKSKKGSAIVDDIQKKLDRLKEELDTLNEKIKTVREQIKAEKQPAPETPAEPAETPAEEAAE